MNWLAKIEYELGRVIEFIFQPRKQKGVSPRLISRALLRALDAERRLGVKQTYVPNSYTVCLSPEDYQQLAPLFFPLQEEMVEFLKAYIQKVGLILVGPLEINFKEKEDIGVGQVQIQTAFQPPVESKQQTRIFTNGSLKTGVDAEKLQAETKPWSPLSFKEPRTSFEAVLTIIEGVGLGQEFVLTGGSGWRIGRQEGEILLADPTVSRQHAQIRRQADAYIIQDLKSANGTFINGKRIHEKKLQDGDLIKIGDTVLRFKQGVDQN